MQFIAFFSYLFVTGEHIFRLRGRIHACHDGGWQVLQDDLRQRGGHLSLLKANLAIPFRAPRKAGLGHIKCIVGPEKGRSEGPVGAWIRI